MGDLLNSLGLGGPKPKAVHPAAALAGAPPASVTPAAYPAAGMPVPDGMDITVTGDGWKPKKAGFLKGAVDGYLMANRLNPVFGPAQEKKNMQEALAGYGDDPEAALRRLMRIPGQQATGLSLYNQLADNKRADSIAGRQEDVASMKYMGRLGGMLNSIQTSKDPAGQYSRMLPNLRAYAQRYNLPLDGLPDTYDADAIQTYTMGNVDVDDQIKIAGLEDYRRRGLDIRQQSVDNTRDYRNERLQDFDTQEAGRNTRAATNEAGRERRFQQKNPPRRVIKTPNGDMVLSSSGKRGMIGDQKWEQVKPGQWKRVFD